MRGVQVNKKALRYAFKQVLAAAESVTCADLTHKATQKHKQDELCPAEYELQRHIQTVREYVKSTI